MGTLQEEQDLVVGRLELLTHSLKNAGACEYNRVTFVNGGLIRPIIRDSDGAIHIHFCPNWKAFNRLSAARKIVILKFYHRFSFQGYSNEKLNRALVQLLKRHSDGSE